MVDVDRGLVVSWICRPASDACRRERVRAEAALEGQLGLHCEMLLRKARSSTEVDGDAPLIRIDRTELYHGVARCSPHDGVALRLRPWPMVCLAGVLTAGVCGGSAAPVTARTAPALATNPPRPAGGPPPLLQCFDADPTYGGDSVTGMPEGRWRGR